MECNYFIESLDLLLDEFKTYSTIIENTYYIEEGNIYDYINDINLKRILGYVFNKFSSILKILWDKFKVSYNEFIKGTSLAKYRKRLENMDVDVNFPKIRFIYNNLNNSAIFNFSKMSLDEEYNWFVNSINKISKCKDTGSIHSTIIEINGNMIDSNTYLDNKRGEILGFDTGISKEDFIKQVVLYFRPGEYYDSGVIYSNDIRQITDEYFSDKYAEKGITRDQEILQNAVKSIEEKLSNININKCLPDKNINFEIASLFSNIIRNYCNKIQGLCDIYIEIFSVKLDIIAMYKNEQAGILSKVISKYKGGKIND